MSNAIVAVGYDPFASPHDDRRADIVGSLWGSIKKVAKAAASPVVDSAKAQFNFAKQLSKGHIQAAASGLWHDAKKSLNHSANFVNSKEGRWALAGAAIVFPPAAPAAAGIVAAGNVLRQLDAKNPKQRAAAALSIATTQRMAKVDPAAARGLVAINVAQSMMRRGIKVDSLGRNRVYQGTLITNGRALEGKWVRV